MVKLSKKRGEQVAVTEAPWDLFPGESDHKIFQFISGETTENLRTS